MLRSVRTATIGLLMVATCLGVPARRRALAADASAGPDGPSVAPSTTVALASLLTVSDLPPELLPDPVGDGTDFTLDWDALVSLGALEVVDRVWETDAAVPVRNVFDFRMTLPTPDVAHAYLSEAEPILSEAAASGLALVPDAPVVGDESRYYEGRLSVGTRRSRCTTSCSASARWSPRCSWPGSARRWPTRCRSPRLPRVTWRTPLASRRRRCRRAGPCPR